ncbi:MAG TPA: ABC transporter ATP-binding protein, partial [Pelotomaculum sp.]|nr:ABC transporter ATP-binding protein [Pelotomaculum sp.]
MCKAIELRDVCYRYPNSSQPSLNNLTFSVPKGAFVVVMGRSGAGKTTLSLCLNGLIPQFLEGELNGAVVIDGQDVCLHSVQSMVRHIGLVLDDPETQIFGRTVWEDAAFGPANLSLPIKDIRRRVDDALKSVHLQGYEERETAGLSGGEKQRLAIAGVLALQPEILALDEPTSELDPVGRTEIYHTIDTLRSAKQLTIFVTEQNSEEIICRADELLVLDRGVIAWQGIPQEFFRNIPLVTEFGIRPLSVGLVGWDFYQKGWIAFKEIPLDVAAAGKLIGSVLIKRNLIDRINGRTAQPGLPPAAKAPVLIRVNNLNYRYTPDRIAL